jgi:peptide-methionine (R)-S-oxide reductase
MGWGTQISSHARCPCWLLLADPPERQSDVSAASIRNADSTATGLRIVFKTTTRNEVTADETESARRRRDGRLEATAEQEWRARLTPEQYEVLRNKGTERPFTGAYASTKEPGVYRCAGCGAALFSSTTKYESGTGWPSFWEPIEPEAVVLHDDRTLWMHRTEVTCARCGGHLGHVFSDGPRPTGDRFCMNSVSLELEPEPQGE